jgi:hypothetical protein
MFRMLAFLVLFFCHAVQAEPRDAWFGRYIFTTSGMNATGTRSWVEQDLLDVRPDGDRIVAVYNATLNADGFDHLAQRWIGHERAGAIDFSFDTCLPRSILTIGDANRNDVPDEECTDQHLRGTPMLTLATARGKNGKRIVLTYFHAFEPKLDKVPAGGVRYFQKAVPD